MHRKLLAAAAACLLALPGAFASVVYHFEFSELTSSSPGGGVMAPFAFDLTYADYVTTTGLVPLSGPALPTSLGYSIAYAGTNSIGWWAFDDDNKGGLDDRSYFYGGNSFLFSAVPEINAYITAPGTYAGFVSGNSGANPAEFHGNAVLTVRQTGQVPEPGVLALSALALAALAWARRRQA